MTGVSRSEIAKVWTSVRRQFKEVENGVLQNERLANDRAEALAKVQKLTENGKKGGRPTNQLVNQTETKRLANEKQIETKRKAKPEPYISTPNGVGEIAETPPSEREPNHAYDPVARVIFQVRESLGLPPPVVKQDITPYLPEDSPVQVLIQEFGEDGARDVFVHATRTWNNAPTWPSVVRQRDQLFADMNGKKFGEAATIPTIPKVLTATQVEAIHR